MKKLGFVVMTMLACCLLVTPLASAQDQKTGKAEAGSAEEQIKALQAQLIQAILKGDASFYQKYFADDGIFVHGDGSEDTKASEIEALKSGSLKYDSYTVRDLKIRMYGSTAVVDTEASGKGLLNSKPFDTDLRVTYVWVKLKGDWKLVARQVTRIAKGQ
jgi:uncharacterized protein (TIGR02246 family)